MKSQIRFLEDLDKIEKQKKDKIEQEKIFRAAKVDFSIEYRHRSVRC